MLLNNLLYMQISSFPPLHMSIPLPNVSQNPLGFIKNRYLCIIF